MYKEADHKQERPNTEIRTLSLHTHTHTISKTQFQEYHHPIHRFRGTANVFQDTPLSVLRPVVLNLVRT